MLFWFVTFHTEYVTEISQLKHKRMKANLPPGKACRLRSINFQIAGKLLLFLLVALLYTPRASGQVPQGFTYQAVAISSSGEPIRNTLLPVRISIESDSLGGTLFWRELHSSVTTNASGLFSLVLGRGVRQAGDATTFADIDWSVTPKFIRTEIDYGGWKTMGASRLWSVPFAMTAGDISGSLPKLAVFGTTSLLDEALFEVKNRNGQTVFAVYNEGVRVNVGNGENKAVKGGFAIGSFDASKADPEDLFVVSRDSVRVYLVNTIGKAVKGGFAIGSFDASKAPAQEYLRITNDSIRMYVNDNPAKAVKGGFAIGSFDASKAANNSFTSLTPDNYFIGHKAGSKNTSGVRNSVLGYESAVNNTEGSGNVFLGYQSGYSNVLGINNIFIGSRAGYNNIGAIQTNPFYLAYGSENVFIGNEAGFSNISGWTNLFLGNGAGYGNLTGTDNTYLGNFCGQENTDGVGNVLVGAFAGRYSTNGRFNFFAGFYSGNQNQGTENTFVGSYSGENNIAGFNNSMFGAYAGKLSTGSDNVFLGSFAGFNESGSGKLYIENSTTGTPLIGGDFVANRVGINRMPTTYTLEVGGTIWANGSTISAGSNTWSDVRYKKDILNLDNVLEKILMIDGVSYNWRTDEFPDLNFPAGSQLGVIAQDVEKVFPDLVFTDSDGFKSVSYEKFVPVLIEAIQEQQQMIETQQKENRSLQAELQSLRAEVEAMKAIILNPSR